jgi:hypothetical protein
VSVEAGYGPTLLQVQALGAYRVFLAQGLPVATDQRGLRDPTTLAAGGAVSLRVGKVSGANDASQDPRR